MGVMRPGACPAGKGKAVRWYVSSGASHVRTRDVSDRRLATRCRRSQGPAFYGR
jgi:hypothetical protein